MKILIIDWAKSVVIKDYELDPTQIPDYIGIQFLKLFIPHRLVH